nr:hypothetical protein BaRGS_025668 [Batillaria attramentaria]
MRRRLRTTLPTLQSNLEPQPYDKRGQVIMKNDAKGLKAKSHSKKNFDKHHGATHLPEFHPGDCVLQKLDHESRWSNPARVVSQVAPRSYRVETPVGSQYRRNRKHLRLSHSLPTGGLTQNATYPVLPQAPGPTVPVPDPVPKVAVVITPGQSETSAQTGRPEPPATPVAYAIMTPSPAASDV